jgi:glycosyltransferase involved in cell wall biosynthesis
MKLSVIIPVYNSADVLGRVLQAVTTSDRAPDEIIVVDNGSTDRSAEIAQAHGACVIATHGQRRGPAQARNFGAEQASGDVLVFVDADVAVHAEALRLIEQTLCEHPEVAAVFGSYDDDPPGHGLVSQYKNLLHHYVHQHGHREASTFWTGCGAIRREAFLALGGFDERYIRPSIEDIDLGARLRRAGQRVWLCPDVQATHLKHWTLRRLLNSDIRDRAVPWTRLILREAYLPGDLNLDLRSRLSAGFAWLVIIGLLLGCWTPWGLPLAAIAAASLAALNIGLYRFFVQHGGAGFGLGAIGLHVLYLLYSSSIFAVLATQHFLHSQKAQRWAFWLLLLVTFLKGWLWSAAVPPWQAYDEDAHFGYAEDIAQQRTWSIDPLWADTVERGLARKLLDYKQTVTQREPLDLSPQNQDQIKGLLRQFDQADVQRLQSTRRPYAWFTQQHPPLYYTLQAVVHQLAQAPNALVRLAWMRLLSVLMGVLAVAFTYQTVRVIWPDRGWLALATATLVSFQPMFTFMTATVNNGALEILSYAALAWSLAIIARHGMTSQRGLLLGGILTVGLLTRSSFLTALPLVGGLLLWEAWKKRRLCHWLGWLMAFALPLVLAGWWYAHFLSSGGTDMVSVYTRTVVNTSDTPLLPYLLRYPWLTHYRDFLHDWWGRFGWGDTAYPDALYIALEILTLYAALGWVWIGITRWRRRRTSQTTNVDSNLALTLMLGIGATVGLIAFYTALDYRMALVGKIFYIQGRYFLSPLAAQMLLLVVGWTALRQGRRWVLLILCLGMMALNTYALAGVVIPRYYGGQIETRAEPAGQTVILSAGKSLTREVVLETDRLTRLDVWLKPLAAAPKPRAEIIVNDGEHEIAHFTIDRSQMTAPYPTMLHLSDRAPTGRSLTVTLSGDEVEAQLATDGQLALKTYHPVPIEQWLDRMTVAQPQFYDAQFFRLLGAAYVLSLIALIALLWRSAHGRSDQHVFVKNWLLARST